jgi:hypothetical protein
MQSKIERIIPCALSDGILLDHPRRSKDRMIPQLTAVGLFIMVAVLSLELGWSILAALRPFVMTLLRWLV